MPTVPAVICSRGEEKATKTEAEGKSGHETLCDFLRTGSALSAHCPPLVTSSMGKNVGNPHIRFEI